MKDLWSSALRIIYPLGCPGCGEVLYLKEKLLCIHCLMEMPLTRFENWIGNPMEKVFRGRISIHRASALWYFRKGTPAQQLMHDLKYRGRKEVGVICGRWLGKTLKNAWNNDMPELIVPMPISSKKRKIRGYNQAEMLALGASKSTGIPADFHALTRHGKRGSQTRLGRWTRWVNVEGEFSVNHSDRIKGKHLLLLDDVLTTGASLESLAITAIKGGASRISIATLCYTDHG